MAERITFNVPLYAPEAIEAAASAYSDFAKISVEKTSVDQGGNDMVVVIDEVAEHDPHLVAHAFSNHVLHETITLRRQAALDEV